MYYKPIRLLISTLFAVTCILSCGGAQVRDDKEGSKGRGEGRENTQLNEPIRDSAEGVAAVFDNDLALARDRAINDARNKLVEKVLGTTVSGRSLMENFELVSTLVEAKSYGLVKNEKILSEKHDSEMYTVLLEGTVIPAVVEDAIEDALNRYGRPKFMVLIKETFEGAPHMPGFTETELLIQKQMGNLGFEFVDVQTVQELMKRQRATMTSALNGQITQDVQNLLLNDNGAEVLIIGTAQTMDQTRVVRSHYTTSNMKSKSAIVRLKAIDLYTAKILATDSQQMPGAHIDDDTASKNAIQFALAKILGGKDDATGKPKVGPFIDTIVKQFVKSATHRPISIYITGLDYNGLKRFRDQVGQRIRGVQSVLEKGRVGAAARLEILFAGTTNEFIDELKAKSEKMGFDIEIPSNFPNRVNIQARLLNK